MALESQAETLWICSRGAFLTPLYKTTSRVKLEGDVIRRGGDLVR